MLARSAFLTSSAPSSAAAIVVEMVGDIDATAAQSFAETATRLAPDCDGRLVLKLRHTALLHSSGITLLARAIGDLQRAGTSVDVVAESRRVRTALVAARIATREASPFDGAARNRHVMIVRNADPARSIA